MQTPPSTPPSYPPPSEFPPQPGAYTPPPAPVKKNRTLLYVIIGLGVACLLCVAVGGILTAMGVARLPGMVEEMSTEVPGLQEVLTEIAPTQAVDAGPVAAPSPYVESITMAQDVTEGDMAPINPTTVFTTNSVIHAVVSVVDAPAETVFRAVWYVEDVGDAAAPDSLISETELSTDGTRYIDFNLTPTATWPAGTYRVEVFVNGALHEVVFFTVQ